MLPDDLEEALAVARACHELAASPAYQTSLQGLEAFHVAAMVATPEGPEGGPVREHHHRMLAALRELAGDVLQRASTVPELERLLGNDAEDNELDEDEL